MSLLRLVAYLVLLVLVIGVLLNFVRPARAPEGLPPRPPVRFPLPALEVSGKSPRVYVDPSEVVLRSNITISGDRIAHGGRTLDEALPLSLSMLSSDRTDPELYYTYYAYTIALGSYGLGSREYEVHALPVSGDDRENLSRVGAILVLPEQIIVPKFRLERLSDRSWETVEGYTWIPGLQAYARVGVPRYVLTYAPTYRLNASWTTEPVDSLVVVGNADASYGYEAVGYAYELEGCREVDVVEGNGSVRATECTYRIHTVYRFTGEAVFYAGNESERVAVDSLFAASSAGRASVWYGEGGYFRGLGPLASAELVAYVDSLFAGCGRVNQTYYECYRVYYVSGTEVVKRARALELVKLSLTLAVAAEPYSGVRPSLEVVDTHPPRVERLPFGSHTVVRAYAAWPWEEGRCHLAFYSEDFVEYPRGLELDLGPFSRRIEVLLNVTRRSWLGGVIVELRRPELRCGWNEVCRVEPVVRVEPALLDPPEIDPGSLRVDPDLPERFLEYLVVKYIHDTVDRLIPPGVPYRDAVRYAMLAQIPLSMTKVCALEGSTRLLEALTRGCGDGYTKALLLSALVSFSISYNLTLAPLVELGNGTAWTVFARVETPPLWELDRWGYYDPELKVVATSPEVGLFVRLNGAEHRLTYARSWSWKLPYSA